MCTHYAACMYGGYCLGCSFFFFYFACNHFRSKVVCVWFFACLLFCKDMMKQLSKKKKQFLCCVCIYIASNDHNDRIRMLAGPYTETFLHFQTLLLVSRLSLMSSVKLIGLLHVALRPIVLPIVWTQLPESPSAPS